MDEPSFYGSPDQSPNRVHLDAGDRTANSGKKSPIRRPSPKKYAALAGSDGGSSKIYSSKLQDRILTVGDLRAALSKFDDDLPLLHSLDEKGSEFRKVIRLPDIVYVKKQNPLELISAADVDVLAKHPERYEKCLIIN